MENNKSKPINIPTNNNIDSNKNNNLYDSNYMNDSNYFDMRMMMTNRFKFRNHDRRISLFSLTYENDAMQ